MAGFFDVVRRRWPGPRARTTGLPPSANGASSFHLRWQLPGPFVAAAATLEVTRPPAVDRLYFWALQVSFVDAAGRPGGAAHVGLQWHPSHPGSTAVNWGGYDAAGAILPGTDSPLPSALDNANTRDFPWVAGRRYRLVIARAAEPPPPGSEGRFAWQATVVDLVEARAVAVRALFASGDRLADAIVWSEVFARCDDPAVEVRWSDLEVTDEDGRARRPEAVTTSYQNHADGGCANTESTVDGGVLVQRTATPRSTPADALLSLGPD
ncbi:MAG: hypothetical protein OEY23_00545 [Acidimicrobiia bacterium]|nr:hypothetical protein [Acidimicrobiia bacterium]